MYVEMTRLLSVFTGGEASGKQFVDRSRQDIVYCSFVISDLSHTDSVEDLSYWSQFDLSHVAELFGVGHH